jgi:hypothetical protein
MRWEKSEMRLGDGGEEQVGRNGTYKNPRLRIQARVTRVLLLICRPQTIGIGRLANITSVAMLIADERLVSKSSG